MEDQKQKSEFTSQVEVLAQQAVELGKKYSDCGIIILSAEKLVTGYADIIAVSGCSRELIECIANLATNEQSKSFVKNGLALASAKMMSNLFERVAKDQEEAIQEQKDNNN